MADKTLLKDEIRAEAKRNGLLSPFVEERLQGASYDIAVGPTIIFVSEDRLEAFDLQVQREYEIPPGRTAVLYSYEKILMPNNMKGRLSLKARKATQLLFFAGGPIDPGYKGHLFLPIVNLSDTPTKITYGEAIVTAEFIWLDRKAEPYSDQRFDSIPPDRLPGVPPAPVHTVVMLTKRVEQQGTDIDSLRKIVESQQTTLAVTSRVVEIVILGALAGVLGGLVAGAFVALFA